MRVLLDVHVSSRHVGRPLEAAGHDVLALDQDELLRRLTDEELLAFATEARRVVATHNHRDFAPILRRWAEAGRHHSGCVMLTFPHDGYGTVLRGLATVFTTYPAQGDWIDRPEFIARSG